MKKLLICGLLAAQSLHANVISWNKDAYGTIGGPSQFAGVVSAANWNNSWPANPTVDLIDANGSPTTLDITLPTHSNYWVSAPTNAAPGVDADGTYNRNLLNGYMNSNTAAALVISEIPYASYDLYVYFSSDVADRAGSVSLSGGATYYFDALGKPSISGANAVFAETTDATDDADDTNANYAKFTGLSGTSQTVTVTIPAFGGIAGFQIVNTAIPPAAPQWLTQPANTNAFVGSSVSLTSSASGNPAATYQWQYSSTGAEPWNPISVETNPTATSPSLLINPVALTDAGYYRAVATNTSGSITSDAAQLTVTYPNPVISQQPVTSYAQTGSNVTFQVFATGYGNLSYQWFKNGSPLDGETEDFLELTSVSAADDGAYYVVITDDIAPGVTTTSQTAFLFTYAPWSGLVSHEPFDGAAYVPGSLATQNPVIGGYQDPWAITNGLGSVSPLVSAGSLAYANPLYLASTGDKVSTPADATGINVTTNSGRVGRLLSPALVVTNQTTGTRYLSWLFKSGNENAAPNPQVHQSLALFQGALGNDANRRFDAGSSDDYGTPNYGFRLNNSGALIGNLGVPTDSSVRLFVAKFELSADPAADVVTVWIDPALGSGEPVGGVTLPAADLAWDRLAFSDYASNSSNWDEIRWGSTFDSVTLTTTPPDTFATWIGGYPVGTLNGFNDDSDNDGLDNGVENFLGSNPSISNPSISQVTMAGVTLSFQHPQNATPASDIAASYLWSSDLVNWYASGETNGGTTVTFTATPNTPATGITSVSGTITGTTPAKLFTRLSVMTTPQ